MKDLFGAPVKKRSIETDTQKHLQFLEKQVERLEKQLELLRKQQETTLQELKKTESQKQPEDPIVEKTRELEETETIFHEEESFPIDEPDYILLEKPQLKRAKAIKLLEKEAVKEVSTHRREIILKKIEEELRKQELSAKELKILFVDEYEYCSKATFYRYLETLRKEQRIDSIKINGKEYLCSIPQKPTF
ncbi:MAG: transcriptional repressor [Nanoarchaeota archaeon]|nr:transcriptional repressor [Nanoarchaeota archaeon]